jgi:uncharacterized Zn finger protein (UPF0148 family)
VKDKDDVHVDWKICSRCGKKIFKIGQWGYKRGNKIFCGFPCSDADFKEEEAERRRKKELVEQKAIERKRKQEKRSYEKKRERAVHKDVVKTRYRRVLQFTTDGKFVAEYDSISKAADSVNRSYSVITSCARGRSNTAGGYVFRYADECEVAERDE